MRVNEEVKYESDPSVAFVVDGAQVVVANLATSDLFAVPEPGARIWLALVAGASTREIALELEDHFSDLPDGTALAHVDGFVARLVSNGLVRPAQRE